MPVRVGLFALLLAGGCARPVVSPVAETPRAQKPAKKARLPTRTETPALLRPCVVDSAAFQKASRDVDALGIAIESLADAEDPAPRWTALLALLETECFALHGQVRMYSGDAAPSSGLSLRTWWQDGGELWTRQFLELDTTWQRPSVRRVLAPELLPDHPLADMFCPLAKPDCDPRTKGWRLRAVTAFEGFAERRWVTFHADDEDGPTRRDWGDCRERALLEPSEGRYQSWTRCVDAVTLRESVFPIGGLRVPTDGWLVLRGRRGHYGFCDEIRLFDLATGSVHVAASCSGLALRDDGSVDGRKTNDGRVEKTTSGRVPVDALREAAWLILWSTEVPNDQVRGGSGFPLVDEIQPMVEENSAFVGGGGFMTSSGQTTLDWAWIREGHPVVHGELRWPEDYNDGAKAHAVALLQVAEAALVEGCAPRGVPRIALVDGGRGVSAIDAQPGDLDDTQVALGRVLVAMKPKRCR